MEVVLPRRVAVGHRLVQLLRCGHHHARAGGARDCESVVRDGAVGPAALCTTVRRWRLLRRLATVLETRGTRAVVRARGARRGGAVALFGQLVRVGVGVRVRARARVVGIWVGAGVRGQFGVRG